MGSERLLHLVLLVGIAACRLAGAQEAVPAESSLSEIVVTAQHKTENIQDVPITIAAFSSADIKALNLQTTTDLGFVTPNVNIALSQGAGNQPIITIRGIGINDENTNNAGPIAVYVDDVYQSSPASQTFSLFDLERVEVLKGPQGTLYGRNTSGGAISYVSAKPTDTLSAQAHIEYSSFNTVNFEGAVGGPIAPILDARVAVLADHSDGYVNNFLTGNKENGTNDQAIRAQLLFKPIDDLKVLLNLHGGHIDTRPAEYGHYGDFVPGTQQTATPTQCSVAATLANQCVDIFGYTQPNGYYNGAFNKQLHLKITTFGTSLRADYAFERYTLTSITAFDSSNKIEPEDTDSSPYRELEINWGVSNKSYTQEFRVSRTEARYNWVGGLYYLHEDLYQNQPLEFLYQCDQFPVFGLSAGPGECDGIANVQTDSSHQITNAYAAFGQGEFNITDDLKLILGARFTDEHRGFEYNGSIRYQQGGMGHFAAPVSLIPAGTIIPQLINSNVSWRTGLDYKLATDVLSYASVATGFKSGDFNGGFLSTVPAQAAVQLQPVGPEKDIAYEVGIKSTFFDRRLKLNVAAFYTDYSDLQVFSLIPSPVGPLNSLTSAKKAHNEGADIEIVGKPLAPLTLTANVGLLTAKLDKAPNVIPGGFDLSGLQLAFSPHVSAFLMADYKIPLGSAALDLQVNGSYKSHQFYDSTNDPYLAQPAYWIGNARVAYEFDHGHWEVAGSVKNFANKQYNNDAFDSTGPFGFIQPVLGTPRWWYLRVSYNYK
jgi:iron complex outermembrane receptor protein